ncbi:MAG: hypothetical protein KIH69_015980 [Anaerolineae bacterium]|nr:hypothetical protein [Anaerolineae bacterium]
MQTISITPDLTRQSRYRASSRGNHAEAATIGGALDALNIQTKSPVSLVAVFIQNFEPDVFFDAEQTELLKKRMAAAQQLLDSADILVTDEVKTQAILVDAEQSIEDELRAAIQRSDALLSANQ